MIIDDKDIPYEEVAGVKLISAEHILDTLEPYLVVDHTDRNLDQVSLRCGRAFAIAQRFYLNESRGLEKLLAKRNQVELRRRQYYLGQLPQQHYKTNPLSHPVLKTEVDLYLKADEVIAEINSFVEEQKRKVKMIEQIFDRIRQMGYEVKTAVDWRKYLDGA